MKTVLSFVAAVGVVSIAAYLVWANTNHDDPTEFNKAFSMGDWKGTWH